MDGARFVPGAMLLERYRIVGLLGRGGMGEVYRAEDLKLGQIVALKFLPASISQDAAALARFHREVRIARQVSHPNICRVFDIGEVDDQVFLSMEFIDGEDLGSLLRRIGRLPADKALEIARQLCAGLAAAHETGVLHRDLKPANVMIDGRGKARITDFGLAVLGDDSNAAEARAGTPGYMAPEQVAGKDASARSDIYSLGLVFYELFTGKRAFEGTTIRELLRKQEEGSITHPSSLVSDMNPVVERVILRCLEKEPRSRPASALQVALALPGGDPLAAALAAGETPSPEMVAAAGDSQGLRPVVAWACVAMVIAGLLVMAGPLSVFKILQFVPMEKPPAVLAERAQNFVHNLGYPDAPADSAEDFVTDQDFVNYIAHREPVQTRWKHEVGPLYYYFRASSQPLYTFSFFSDFGVDEEDPALKEAGASIVRLSPKGRLLKLIVVPPQVETPEKKSALPADWATVFRDAGYDFALWAPTAPQWTPPNYADSRAAWTGSLDEFSGTPMRIEAAAYRGKPVYFELIAPWTRPGRSQPYQPTSGEKVLQVFQITLLVVLVVGAVLLARRNLHLGRGDRRGAWRIAAFVFCVAMFTNLGYHVNDSAEIGILVLHVAWGMFVGGFVWLLYIALEPLVRRRWPTTLVSWSRLLAGEFRDALVGRDLLLGIAASGLFVLVQVPWLFAYRHGYFLDHPFTLISHILVGTRFDIEVLVVGLQSATFVALALVFLLFLMRLLLRRDWLVVIVTAIVFSVFLSAQASFSPLWIAVAFAQWLLIGVLVLRCGLLSLVAFFFSGGTQQLVLTLDPSKWYFSVGIVPLILMFGLVTFAFHTSLGGKSPFGGLKLEEG